MQKTIKFKSTLTIRNISNLGAVRLQTEFVTSVHAFCILRQLVALCKPMTNKLLLLLPLTNNQLLLKATLKET